ncbi:MAG: DUF3473 domain-containing protein [Gammaproteobacteria bacterium]|nr:DUF3473 domain-containing protein [Gammaproteobacteria bacterium]
MTVDVEDYFHVSAFESHIPRAAWDSLDRRVEANTELLLDLFAQVGCQATFFTLAWVARRHPALIRRITAAGHELASHGCEHVRITQFDRRALQADLGDSKKLLEDLGGVAVLGYRAPSFSVTRGNLWALAEIAAAGYRYSSSIYPVRHDLYGIPDAPRFPFLDRASGLLEIPMTTVRLGGRNLPIGGGFFRFYPYAASRWAFARVNRLEHQPVVFYTHPWEYDPEQPRQDGAGWKARTRHYLNLDKTTPRLRRLLRDFAWDRMDRVFLAADDKSIPATRYRSHAWN